VEKQRKKINVPDLEGYTTLKCDFHMHTIFSDGIVWPTLRVYEAYYEGLDAISITDHIENNPSKPFVGGDDNSSYEIAKDAAKDYNIILVRGGEITRDMPPGHLNAIFLDDVNKLDTKDPYDAIMEAHRQGAFITWNHPGWKAQQPDTCLMFDEIKDLIERGLFMELKFLMKKSGIRLHWAGAIPMILPLPVTQIFMR
jgi:3',5'-nucleoside bisphosphate phosphatase